MTSIGVLLQSIDRNQRTIKFSEYKGKTVAIDGDDFLLDGASRAALEPVWNHSANSYNDYLLEFTQLLEENSVTPIMVFGGLTLLFKQSMNYEYRKARQAALNSASHLEPVTISEDMAIATITTSHLGTPFSAAAPKSQKSPKSSTSSASRMGPKRVLSELSNVTTVSVSVATTAGEFSASTSAQASSHLPRPTVATPKESTAACPSVSLPPSVEQPLMPLTEASTTSTHDDPISPPHAPPTKDEMSDTTTTNVSNNTTVSINNINNINASVSKVSQDTNQTSSGQTCETNSPSPPLSPPTATSIKENTASYNQHTGAKPLADKSAQPVKITPPPSHYIPNIAHINPFTNNIATSIKQTAIPTQQDTLARPNASEISQAVNMTPSSDHVSYNAHVNFSTSNTTIAATITAIKLSQNASNGGGEENGNNNSSKYDMRDPYYNNPNYFIPTNMASRSNNEKSKKRSFTRPR
ncbi:uncharacterized protein ATC70_000350 [Mucor velutinosus]|uniref:XPG N-terminal domain-containing protein n=1 Tax=Mucor velutinosus TaxID=708070 RepID=A0AAN7DGF5_9FUNG|nr:hypothetical protein ATC70_000350 [Mucor velutinosus]